MATNELLDDPLNHVVDREDTGFGLELGVEDHLQEHVSKLLDQMVHVSGFDRLDGLVALFNQIALERLVILLAIPGASALAPQPGHHPYQILEALLPSIVGKGRNKDSCEMVDRNPIQP